MTGLSLSTSTTRMRKLLSRARVLTIGSTGWQRFDFNSSVSVTAGTNYVIYYFQTEGADSFLEYPHTANYFTSSGVTQGNLYALSQDDLTVYGGNAYKNSVTGQGVFHYEATYSQPPYKSFQSTNYWVDPIFEVPIGRVIRLIGHVRIIGGVRFGGTSPVPRRTCGAGSNVSFTDIGGGECRAFITTAVASGISNSLTIPTNWNSSSNYIMGIGGGGGGCGGPFACAGSGGEYRRVNNFSASGGASIAIVVGAGGTGGGPSSVGTDGATTTFNTTTLKADSGKHGVNGGNAPGGHLGTGANGNANGGAGGNAPFAGGGGGGGAGGPLGTGGAGADGSNQGGSGRGGNSGGSAGVAPSGDARNGSNGGDNQGGTGHGVGDTTGGGATAGRVVGVVGVVGVTMVEQTRQRVQTAVQVPSGVRMVQAEEEEVEVPIMVVVQRRMAEMAPPMAVEAEVVATRLPAGQTARAATEGMVYSSLHIRCKSNYEKISHHRGCCNFNQ